MDNKRIAWIDNLRGLCMVFVCFHHSGDCPVWFVKFYVPIFLTSFFFVSGFLFHNPSRTFSVKQKFMNIATTLVLPYVIYCSCCICLSLVTKGIDGLMEQIYLSLYGIKSWFISALILCQMFCLMVFIIKKDRRQWALLFTSLLSLILYFGLPPGEYFWNFRNALLAYFFLGCGVMAKKRNLIHYLLENKRLGMTALWAYVIFIIIDIKYDLLKGCFNGTFSSYPVFFLENVVGIPAIIYICSRITRYNRLLLFIGANSLLYYYLPTLTNIVTDYVLAIVHLSNTSFPMLILIVMFKCLLMIIPVWFINKYIPAFAGKYKIKLNSNR